MKSTFFLFICFCFSYCFAQTNPIEYFYEGRCEPPDFAALAVLESQHCPHPIPKYENYKDSRSEEYKRYIEQSCISRYRILRVLDAASDAFRKKYLAEEYLEAKDELVFPYYRHRPMLIFGKHKNGVIQIEGREETREYFSPSNAWQVKEYSQRGEFLNILARSEEIYSLHSIGTPYYNAKNLDRIDSMFYLDYLLPNMKYEAEAAGKNINELLLRLIHNRTPIKATKIKNDFAALGTVRKVRPVGNSEHAKFYELSLAIETIIKNDSEAKSNIAIYIDKSRLPPDWNYYLPDRREERRKPFYFFGNLVNGSLVIESLASTRDAFAFGDTIYDISMGISFEELIAYFLPSNISLEELKFGSCWTFLNFAKIRKDGPYHLASTLDSLRDAITEIAIKWAFFDNKREQRRMWQDKNRYDFLGRYSDVWFRCRKIFGIIHIDPHYYSRPCERCKVPFTSEGEGGWGRL
ncbi:MAG: hypothetical protein LBU89_03255 [Fibromonadaceae bacterium]|jgi:hypothetical protein|nr:hypothetical protein [Fibromonadaceae bacterium]